MKKAFSGLLILYLALSASVLVNASPLEEAERASQEVRQKACELARWAVERQLEGKPLHPLPFQPEGILAKPVPCFITISLNDRRRGCTGNFEPQGRNLAENIVQTAVRAWSQDPRTRRLNREQIKQAVFHVTIPGKRQNVASPDGYPPANYGLLVRGQGRHGVLLPGEARTGQWQIAEAKRQAGMSPDAPVTFEVFRAVTFSEKRPEKPQGVR